MLPVESAAICSLVGGYLLLPSGLHVDIHMVPPIDKASVSAVSTWLLCWMKGPRIRAVRQSWIVYALAMAFVLSPIFTSLDNSYELQTAAGSIPGFYPLDALKLSFHNLIVLAPFFVGARFLCSDGSRTLLLKYLIIAALVYSFPMLFEIRFSPQLHTWVYGYFPHSFAQQIRAGGFRPVVFLEHGLQTALFTSLALIAALVGTRARWRILQLPAALSATYLSMLLVLCKSLGAIVYAAILSPVILFTRPRFWTKIACALLLTLCAYPLLRSHGLIPVQLVHNAAKGISGDRAGSFEMRVDNEDQLLARANEKPIFGWGTWGRNRIRDEATGQDVSVTDGLWVIQYGMFGWFGYLSLFGLLGLASYRAARAVGHESDAESIALGGLSLLLAVNAVDLVPNSNLTSLTFLIAGAIASSVRGNSKASVRLKIPRSNTPMVVAP
jgi:hypothetical protein